MSHASLHPRVTLIEIPGIDLALIQIRALAAPLLEVWTSATTEGGLCPGQVSC